MSATRLSLHDLACGRSGLTILAGVSFDVAEGEAVTAGQRLMVLEAMKMEHALIAPFDGTVTDLSASEGAQVQVEAVLCVVEPASED